jgi:DNA-binding transcriptional LysR family regulator
MRDGLRAVLAEAAKLQEQVDATRSGRAGPVRVPSTTYPQAARFIAEAIAVYAGRYPDAPLPTRVPIGTADVYDALTRGDIDLTAGVPPPGHAFQSAPLRDVEIVAVGPGIDGRPIEVRDLAGRALAMLTPEYQSRRQVDAAMRAERITPQLAYEDVYPEALLVLARRGVATAILVTDALPLEIDFPVSVVRHRGRGMGGRLLLLWRDEATLSTSARRFRDAVLEVAGSATPGPARPRARAASRPRRPPAVRAR